MLQFFKIAFRNIMKNRTRSALLATSIIITSMILTVLMAMTAGIQDTMLRSSTILLTGHINVAGFYKISASSAAPEITNYRKLDKITRDVVKDAESIISRVKGWGKIISDSSSMQTPIWGIDITKEKGITQVLEFAAKEDYIEDFEPVPGKVSAEGSFDEMIKPGGIMLFATHAKRLKVRVGDSITVSMPTYRNMYNTKDLKVVAVLKDIGFLSQFSTFMHEDDLRDIYQMNDDTTGQIMVYLKDVKDVPRVENELRKAMAANGFRLMEKDPQPFWQKFEKVVAETWTGLKIDVTTWEDEISFMKWVISTFSALSITLVLVLLFIIVLGITNAIWISIKERTNEIGTLRSIGMHRRKIVLMFVLEGFTLSGISALIGIMLGVIVCVLLNWAQIPVHSLAFRALVLSDHLYFLIRIRDLLFSFVVITAFTTSGSLIPAYRASKMKPITAINYIN